MQGYSEASIKEIKPNNLKVNLSGIKQQFIATTVSKSEIMFSEAKAALNCCCAHLLGRGMLGGGLGTVGIGIGRGPLPGTWTPAAATLRPSREPLPSGSAGSGFWGGLGLSKS